MYPLLRRTLFLFDAEKVHYFSTFLLKFLLKFGFIRIIFKKLFVLEDPKLERTVFGLKFKNPVGMAAGFDKNAEMFNDLAYCGFGFIEVGTLTPLGQSGNPKPRLFRITKDKGILNRLGFNNKGVASAIPRLKDRKHSNLIIGGNIGKNKITPNEDATNDYVLAFEQLFPYVDYFVVNVSSPNTANLRDLQEKEPLTALLSELKNRNSLKEKPKPILLKIAPDLTNLQLDDIIEIVRFTKIDGVIATNTTIERDDLKTDSKLLMQYGAGGISGKPLAKRSTEVIRYLHDNSKGEFPIIGVGGIHSADDALEKLAAGASLIQLYTGFIYEGPGIVRKINEAILKQEA
jgi:dihydroorotate dehydrogenase